MIESGDEPGCRTKQHAVAEDVARHVADAGSGERRGLDIGAELAEMALDCLPGAARGDAHLLVVIALAAARSEGIAEPMMLFGRHRVGGVGEGGGALVGGDDEIGIVAIVAHGVVGRHDGVAVEIVGELEQRAHEDAIGSRCLPPSRPRDLRAAAGRLGTKPPLAPTGTITAFLTCCALTRPRISVRKSCGRSDQRNPPRATLPKRR